MAMLCRTSSDFRNLLLNADPAGLLSDGLLDHLSHALVSPGLLEVSHRDECSACGHRMQRKLCVSCHILTPHGLEPATHVALSCRIRQCASRGKVVWANFASNARGDHTWSHASGRPEIAMMTPHFGVTWSWHSQFSRRILHHHASFLGESLVHDFDRVGLGHGHERVADAWLKLQLLPKWRQFREDPFPLSLPFAAIFERCREAYDVMVRSAFQESSIRPVAAVIDGNQKLTRRTCAEQMAEIQKIPGTPLCFLQDCSRTPKRKQAFCSLHCRQDARDNGVRVSKKACIADSSHKLMRATPPNSVDLSWPLVDWVRDQVHIQSKARHCSSTEDLDICEAQDYVSCHTVKMRKRVNRRSGGWLVACDGRGMVLAASEFYAGESLTQRAAFVASVVDQFPTVTTVVHDDACHLRKFMDKWMDSQPRLTYPQTKFVLDKFHAPSHRDPWCKQHCCPKVPENARLLAGVNSSSCEFLFSWFSKFRSSFRTMNRQTAHFFVHEILLMRNAWRKGQEIS